MESPSPYKLKTPERPQKNRHQEHIPVYLYHGTPIKNFESISESGLIPFSKGEKGIKPYVSLAPSAHHTPVLSGNRPSDIIFRIKTRTYRIFKGGAGKGEYRTNDEISPNQMWYVERKYLNTKPVPWKQLYKGTELKFI